MTTSNFDDSMAEFEQEIRYIGKGDLIFKWGRFEALDWRFIGIPLTRIGVSYYVATGDEDYTQYSRLMDLLEGKRRRYR